MPPPPSRLIAPVVVLLSFAVGYAGSVARNVASDDAMFASARASNQTTSYHRYLELGDMRHAAEVRTTLLPRAALDEAVARDDVHALQAVLRDFPGSGVETEARGRFDAACHKRLDAAISLESLRLFEESSLDCGLEREIAASRVRLHEGLLHDAQMRGIHAIRDYVRRYPDSPVSDHAVMALRAAFQDVRAKVRAMVDRPEMREAILGIVDRSEATGIPVTFFVPMTLETEPDTSEEMRHHMIAAFDRAIGAVLESSIAYVYHPASLANVDVAHNAVLRVDTNIGPEDFDVHVRFELASGGRKTTWKTTLHQARAEVLGAKLAHDAISSRTE